MLYTTHRQKSWDEAVEQNGYVDPEIYIKRGLEEKTLVGEGYTARDMWTLFALGVVLPVAILIWGWV